MQNKLLQDAILIEMVLVSKYNVKLYVSKNHNECPICIDSLYNKNVSELPCGHVFHQQCLLEGIMEYGYKKCMQCNKPLTIATKNIFTCEPNEYTNYLL